MSGILLGANSFGQLTAVDLILLENEPHEIVLAYMYQSDSNIQRFPKKMITTNYQINQIISKINQCYLDDSDVEME